MSLYGEITQSISNENSNAIGAIPLLVLGAGRVVSEFYLPSLALLGLTQGTVVIDTGAEQLAEIAKKWPEVQTRVGDFRDFLRSETFPGPCATIVALPNKLHIEACNLAVAAGFDVLCDKPLALTASDCDYLFETSTKAERIIDVNMCRRYLPSMVAIRRACEENLIGEIVSINIEDGEPYAWTPVTTAPFERSSGGVLADMGVHYLDLVEHFVGKLKPRVYFDDFAGGVEANAVIEVETEKGILARLSFSRTRKLRNNLVIKGKTGSLTVLKDKHDTCLWASEAGLRGSLSPERPFVGNWAPTLVSCFAQKIFEFLKAVRERGSPAISAKDAASTISLIEWAYAKRASEQLGPVRTKKTAARPNISTGRAVVTGGTGFIGSHLVGRLSELGFQDITVPYRLVGNCAEVARYPVSLKEVDLLDPRRVHEMVNGARWVFHLAYGRDGAQANRITIDGTRNVVNAAIASRCECVVVLSTMYVFGDADATLDESHPYRPKGGRYGAEKATMERWCLARSRDSLPTRIVVLNPTCIFGPGGKTFTELPHRLAKSNSFCWIEEGRGTANFCFVDNLVDAILLAAEKSAGHGQRFIINDGAITWREFLTPIVGNNPDRWPSFTKAELLAASRATLPKWRNAVRAILADHDVRDVIKTRMPTSTAIKLIRSISPNFFDRFRTFKSDLELHSPTSETQHTLPPDWLADLFGATSTRFSSALAADVLGWSPVVSFDEAVDITTQWFDDPLAFDGSSRGS